MPVGFQVHALETSNIHSRGYYNLTLNLSNKSKKRKAPTLRPPPCDPKWCRHSKSLYPVKLNKASILGVIK